jgi:hypothetical protein
MTIIIISVKPANQKPQAKVVKMKTPVKETGAKVISMFSVEKQRA